MVQLKYSGYQLKGNIIENMLKVQVSWGHLVVACRSGLIPVLFHSANLRIMQMDVLSS